MTIPSTWGLISARFGDEILAGISLVTDISLVLTFINSTFGNAIDSSSTFEQEQGKTK